ncbi:MAG: AAA family ATPase [Planctomycetes bacterium]|nr:AAA family ATPase [Planctomycetota bacterium]
MLQAIEIKNFRSCEDVRIRLGEPVVAFVGKNGAGKTNILHAIQIVASTCVGDPELSIGFAPRQAKLPTELGIRFTLDGADFEYVLTERPRSAPRIQLEERLTRNDETLFSRVDEQISAPGTDLPLATRLGATGYALPTLCSWLPSEHPVLQPLTRVRNYLSAIRYLPLLQNVQEHAPPFVSRFSNESDVVDQTRYQAWLGELWQGNPGRSVSMRLLHMHLQDPSRLDELRSLLGPGGLGLIDEINIVEIAPRHSPSPAPDTLEKRYAISFMPGPDIAGSHRYFPFTGLSTGTRRVVELLTHLVFDKSSCMLVEQPEDCIHPGLLAKVIGVLEAYSDRTQLICTTHSPQVINLIGAKGLRLVAAADGRTSVTELNDSQRSAVDDYLDDKGTLAEYLELL